MLLNLTLLSFAVALVHGFVVPELSSRNEPTPLSLDFAIQKTIGKLTVKDWWAQHGGRTHKRAYIEPIQDVDDVCYMLNIYLGTNSQKSYVLLDTGSSDLWVPTSSYSHNTSLTAKDTGNAFSITYVDGTTANGEYYTDKLTFDSSQPVLSQFQFAAANASGPGVFGIAEKDSESAQKKYNNLPWALQAAGLTPKASYSLYLGENRESGVIIFGGIDTDKYEGNLTKYKIDGNQNSLSLEVQSISAEGQSLTENAPYLLDSLALVSQNMLDFLNGIFKPDSNGHINCTQPHDQYVSFNFGQNSVNVSYSDSVFSNSDGTCSLAYSYGSGYQILGDIFLRNAYVYYDLTDQKISLAQVKYSSSSNIITA